MYPALLAVLLLALSIVGDQAVAGELSSPQDASVSRTGGLSLAEHSPEGIGVKIIPIAVPERGTEMAVTLWYPATRPGRSILVGDGSPLFQGTAALDGAPMAEGRWPLIILSEGGLRSGPNVGAWMASRLAADGFMVAMLRQPDPTHLTEEQTLPELWLRPTDVSAALTGILGDGALSSRIDTKQIGVLGFQIGGTAALSLAGGLLDVARVRASCDAGGVGVDCGRFRTAGLDLHTVSLPQLGRSNRDPSVKAIIVIDPEFSRSFTQTSLAGISIPVSLINLGKRETIWPGLNAEGLTHFVPKARYSVVSDATQYSAFPECKPGASTILRENGEEAICDDTIGGRSRALIHDTLAQAVASIFHSSFAVN
jgi:predicted dienelactone hydrolase